MAEKKVIAVLEDDAGIRKMIVEVLKKEGYTVLAAESGIEMVSKIIPQKPDLLIMDIMLPYLQGHTVVEAFKKKNVIGDIPVIVISAKEEAEISKVAKEVKAVGWLKKPFDNEAFIEMVKKNIIN